MGCMGIIFIIYPKPYSIYLRGTIYVDVFVHVHLHIRMYLLYAFFAWYVYWMNIARW